MGKPVHVEIIIRDQSQVERMIKKFTKKVKRSGLLDDLKERRYYVKKSLKRRLKRERKKRMSQESTEKSKIQP